MKAALRIAAFACVLASTAAHADRRELYTFFALQPGVQAARGPVEPASSASRLSYGSEVTVYYGITNELHVGGAVAVSYGPDLRYRGVSRQIEDGSFTPTGTYYENALGFGMTAVALYRVDTGYRIAPIGRLDLGWRSTQFVGAQLQPEGRDIGIDFEPEGGIALTGRAAVGIEYRLSDRWVASASVAYRRNIGGRAPWELSLPLAVALVW